MQKDTSVSEDLAASIFRVKMEVARSSKTTVFYLHNTTWHHNLEDLNLKHYL
jgi:hypothetical protein